MNIPQLIDFATDGLVHMFDRDSQLFYHRLTYGPGGVVKEGLSHRYTMMTLLGLHRLEETGIRSPIAVQTVLQGLLSDLGWVNNAGDMGLLLWLVAVVAPDRLRSLHSSMQIESVLPRYSAFRQVNTMQVAWLISGLSHVCIALGSSLAECRDISLKCYELLVRNQGPHGFFGHQATWKSPQGLLRGRIGSFADQVYPILGLTLFAKAHQNPEALRMAQRCGEAICRVQGAQGQWWWHYDAQNGNVFDKFPVYSVHQHGMAPMALFSLGEQGNRDFSGPIFKGLSWIYGDNELGANMFEPNYRVIWRNIHQQNSGSYMHKVLQLVRPGDPAQTIGTLQVLRECRPYELGWLLYAFAGRCGTAMPSTAAAL
jgi:hypothetical protein